MKLNKLSFLFSAGLLLLLTTISITAQEEFSNPNVDYTFMVPNDSWKITVEPSDISPNVEFVYNFKKDGHLEIRKMNIEPKTLFGEIIREEEPTLQFLPGYVAGKEENFRGNYSGRVFNYEYVRSGRPMSGRFYFLKTDDKTVYVLRFTGMKDKLRSIRNETDAIARTFKLKAEK
jgi:hypothetical protein